jgi:hypothetical protein
MIEMYRGHTIDTQGDGDNTIHIIREHSTTRDSITYGENKPETKEAIDWCAENPGHGCPVLPIPDMFKDA